MTIPRLPVDAYKRHFPGSGKGNYPTIETDGDSLIFRRVNIGGEKYDVRIWRWDAAQTLIRLNRDSGFLRETIVEVQSLAEDLFKDNFPDRTDVVVWYDDTSPDAPVCKRDLKSLSQGNPDKYMDIPADHPAQEVMAKIHHLLFHTVTTAISADPNQLNFPREVQKDPVPSINEREGAAASIKKTKKKKDSPLPENIRTHLPPPRIESDPTAADRLAATIQEDLDAASGNYTGAEFLKGITHSQLAEYARLRTGDHPKLAKAYDVYRAVLCNPKASGVEEEAMRDWLKELYKTAYKRFHANLRDVYKADPNKQNMEFKEWCKYYAAKAVVGFLLVDKQPPEPLYELLIATPISSEAAAATGPKKKSSSLSLPFSVDVNGTRVTIEDADITRVQGVEAIVNAANPACLGGQGIDGAIHKAAGPALLKECQALRLREGNVRCPTGEAVITGSGNLARQGIDHVIHAVGPVYSPNDPEGSAKLLKQTYINALNVAYENGIQTIAIPAISTGIYRYPVESAARLAITTVADYANQNPGRFTQIKLLHLGPRAANAAQILNQLQNSPRS